MANKREKKSKETKSAILNAAEKIFLDKGFDGASMSMIAREANVNQSLLSHHFGSKIGLWDASFARLHERYFKFQQETLERPAEDGTNILRDSISGYFKFLMNTPEMTRLQTWMSLSGQNQPPPAAKEIVKQGFERLRLGQEVGLIRKDIPAEFIWASFISLVEHWFQLKGEYQDLLSSGYENETKMDEAYLQALLKIFFDGVNEES